MADQDNAWTAYAKAAAPLIGLALEGWTAGVAGHLATAAAAAALFADLPLDEAEDEAAPVFQPGRRP